MIEPILAGTELPDVPEDDRRYVVDLGLVRRVDGRGFQIAARRAVDESCAVPRGGAAPGAARVSAPGVANGGGTVKREYAIGSGRMDLCLTYGQKRTALDLKVWRRSWDPEPQGVELAQLDRYLAGLGLGTRWLVIFDRRARPWRNGRPRKQPSRPRAARLRSCRRKQGVTILSERKNST